jgi:hypothetical protein
MGKGDRRRKKCESYVSLLLPLFVGLSYLTPESSGGEKRSGSCGVHRKQMRKK